MSAAAVEPPQADWKYHRGGRARPPRFPNARPRVQGDDTSPAGAWGYQPAPTFLPRTVTRTLVVAEKFNTALRISIVLSDGRMKRSRVEGTNVFEFERPEGSYLVTGLRGHIVELDYPAELAEWTLAGLPKLLATEPLKRVTETGIVRALQSVVRKFDRVVIATDFDREGELIGLECLELLQAVHPKIEVFRARYSALTREEIEQSFTKLQSVDHALAEAAAARQETGGRSSLGISR